MFGITRLNKNGMSVWFAETFRTHGAEEYAEFFLRGTGKDGESRLNATYPWVYSRVFFLCLVLFSAFAFVTDFTYDVMAGMGHPVVILLGAMLVNAPVTVLLYELYPGRDLSVFKLLLVFIVGAAISDVLINLGYYLITPQSPWLSILWTAVLEEFSKALPAILAIVALKAKNPLQCFVIAAAVGAGMSVSEDMSYIFFGSINYEISINSAISITLLRALTSVSGHVLWTGLIGWAFGKFKKPLINPCFWGVCVGSVALHYIWDFPLPAVAGFTLAGAFAGGLVILVMLLKNERSKAFYKERGARDDTEFISDGIKEYAQPEREPVIYRFNIYNIAAVACAVIMCACGLLFCTVGKLGGYDELYFADEAEFVSFVQNGEELKVNAERLYDPHLPDYSRYILEGETVEVVQRERDGGRDYYYTYGYDGEIYLSDIAVEIDGDLYYCMELDTDYGEIYFYKTNPVAVNCYYNGDYGEITVDVIEPVTYNKTAVIALGVIAGLAFAAGCSLLVCGILQKRKTASAQTSVEIAEEHKENISQSDEGKEND